LSLRAYPYFVIASLPLFCHCEPTPILSLRAEGVAILVESRDEIASGLAPLVMTVGLALRSAKGQRGQSSYPSPICHCEPTLFCHCEPTPILSLRAEGVAIPVESRDEIASGLAPLAMTVEEAECH